MWFLQSYEKQWVPAYVPPRIRTATLYNQNRVKWNDQDEKKKITKNIFTETKDVFLVCSECLLS